MNPIREIETIRTTERTVTMILRRRRHQRAESPSRAQRNTNAKLNMFLFLIIALLIIGIAILSWVILKKNEQIQEFENQVQVLSTQVRKLVEKESKLAQIITVLEKKFQESADQVETLKRKMQQSEPSGAKPSDTSANLGSSHDKEPILQKASVYFFKLLKIFF
ncbi:hypothetical protein XENTR_v10011558 [Xenopus tropicalis]|nr:hypothetical protein XENTR_v10011558 [Xenopus tropicalis]